MCKDKCFVMVTLIQEECIRDFIRNVLDLLQSSGTFFRRLHVFVCERQVREGNPWERSSRIGFIQISFLLTTKIEPLCCLLVLLCPFAIICHCLTISLCCGCVNKRMFLSPAISTAILFCKHKYFRFVCMALHNYLSPLPLLSAVCL